MTVMSSWPARRGPRIQDETRPWNADVPGRRVTGECLAAGPRRAPFKREVRVAVRVAVRIHQDGESAQRFAARLVDHAIHRQVPAVVKLCADPVPRDASGCIALGADELAGLAEFVVVPRGAAHDTLARAVQRDPTLHLTPGREVIEHVLARLTVDASVSTVAHDGFSQADRQLTTSSTAVSRNSR